MSDSQHHTLIDPARAHPSQSHRLFADPFRSLCIAFLRMTGWKVEGSWPPLAKAVLVAAPHTSNWDGVYMLAAAGFYRVKLRWMGKQSLTTGPLGPLVRWLGCVPIDRANRRDMVASMAAAFEEREEMILAIPPEGTRSLSTEWKSGFYHIAHSAKVPLIISVLDYGTRTIRLAATITTTGNYEADLPTIQRYYAAAKGRHLGKFSAGS